MDRGVYTASICIGRDVYVACIVGIDRCVYIDSIISLEEASLSSKISMFTGVYIHSIVFMK
jgi:hypothetical protein